MSEIIVHIGTHKTGTTTIQDTLFHNRARLRAHGIVYPHIAPFAPHHPLVTEWIALPERYRGRRPALEAWRLLVRAHAGRDRTVLVSSEEFSRLKPAGVDFRRLRALIEPFGRKRIVCCLRNQLGYIQSIYLQVAKNQAFVPFDRFVEGCLETRHATGLALDYNRLLDRLLEGFAPGELTFLSYERSAGSGGLVPQFCRALGLAGGGGDLAPLPRGDSNVSPEPLAFWIAREASGGAVPGPNRIAAAERRLAERFGPGVRTTLFTRDQAARLRTLFEPLNRRLERRLEGAAADFGLASLDLPRDTLYRDDLGQIDFKEAVGVAGS
jgi:hypothetical protein